MRRPRLAVAAALAAALGCRRVLDLEEKRLTADAGDAAAVDAAPDTLPVSGCPEGLAKCGDACVDLTRDPANCGRCGRSCAPSTCEGELCSPRYVTTTGGLTRGITQSDAFVYWTSSIGAGRVARAAKSGTAAPEILVSDAGIPVGVHVRDDNVFWTTPSAGTVSRARIDGGAFGTLLDNQSMVTGITSDESFLYFTRDTAAGDVRKVALDGGPATVVVPSLAEPSGIVVDTTHVYFAQNGLWRVEKGGANPVRLTTDPAAPWLAIDDGFVYVAEPTAIVRIDKTTGVATTIVQDVVAAGLAVDETHVFWTNAAQGVVASVPKTGGGLRNLAVAQVQPSAVMVDATNVYWLAGADGTVFAVPK